MLAHLGLRQTGCMPSDSRSFLHVTSLGIQGHHLCLELDNTYSLVASVILCLVLSGPFPVWIYVSFSLVRPYFFFHNLSTCSLKLPSLFWASRIDLPASLSLVSPRISVSTPNYPLSLCPSQFWLSHSKSQRAVDFFFSIPHCTVSSDFSLPVA